ncbi:monocarboxylate transporter 6 isoform X1 [Acomys russatus]|uniref:monocarboxylate transporter 6 isoform X1 n=1 Tax=Acomys russatus TaxID=60746 RepID=UPI0021E1EB2E|nr:monocarboxylate transporter 6 isoform X1 [Acomys russatus]
MGLGSPTGLPGPLCSILVKRFSCRVAMMVGGVLASLGMVASTFSRSLIHLFLTAGLVTGLLLDATNNFSYVFYMSSCFLVSASLFLGVGFYAADKKLKREDGQAKMEPTASEITPMGGLTSEDKDRTKRQLCPENMYVTSV